MTVWLSGNELSQVARSLDGVVIEIVGPTPGGALPGSLGQLSLPSLRGR